MADYKLTDEETGESYIVSGDKPPTDEDAQAIFDAHKAPEPEASEPISEPVKQPTDNPGLFETLMPRSATSDWAKGSETPKALGKQILSGAADALSLPGRAIGATFGGKGESYAKRMSDTKGENIVQNILRDPATLPSIPVGGPVVSTAGKGALPILKTAGMAALKGAKQGLTSGSIHQAENLRENGKVDVGSAALETGLGAGMGGVVSGAGKALEQPLKDLGARALSSVLKIKDKYRGSVNPPNVENVLEIGAVKPLGGLGKVSENLDKKISEIGSARDAAAEGAGKLNLRGALSTAKKELDRLRANNEIDLKDYNDALAAANVWANDVKDMTAQTIKGKNVSTGWTDMQNALKHRQLVDKKTNWNENVKSFSKGESVFNRIYRDAIEQQAGQISPEVRAATKEMGKFLPAKNAVDDRFSQIKNNYIPDLLDYSALGVGGLAGGLGANDNRAGGVGAGALSLLATKRLLTTPGGAAMLYGAGKNATKSSNVLSGLGKGALRGSFYDKENQK
jgi:hypothetical protein